MTPGEPLRHLWPVSDTAGRAPAPLTYSPPTTLPHGRSLTHTFRYYDLAKAVAAKWGLSATDQDRPGRRPGLAAALYEQHRYRWPAPEALLEDVEAYMKVRCLLLLWHWGEPCTGRNRVMRAGAAMQWIGGYVFL